MGEITPALAHTSGLFLSVLFTWATKAESFIPPSPSPPASRHRGGTQEGNEWRDPPKPLFGFLLLWVLQDNVIGVLPPETSVCTRCKCTRSDPHTRLGRASCQQLPWPARAGNPHSNLIGLLQAQPYNRILVTNGCSPRFWPRLLA